VHDAVIDDVETNLAGARLAGLHTILVGDLPGAALVELDGLLGPAVPAV
jgi:hypothetical protein